MSKNENIRYVNKIYEVEYDMTDERQARNFYFDLQLLCQIETGCGRNWDKFCKEHVVLGA